MSQSRTQSFVEAITNVLVGYAVAVAAQLVVFPIVGIDAGRDQVLVVGLVFTLVSLLRSYALRRLFERFGAST